VFDLAPGNGVHQPPLAPHWVRTGSTYSITLSIPFCQIDFDRRARIYQANHYLRQWGLRPAPPGRSHLGDTLKGGVIGALSYQRRAQGKYDYLRRGPMRIAALEQRLRRTRPGTH
jgi:hypothetical protein